MLCLKIIPPFCAYFIMLAFAFESTMNGEISREIIEQGRSQYQLLKERSNLPQYGTCWKQAVEQVDEGCKFLSEHSQSNIALHLTNCFLEMSGHETYNCELNKKPNLRAICISSMSDRAFTTYTQFYTHTQNMCWFLRGQIWQEAISENTYKVGKQLEKSAENQEFLLRKQEKSLELQDKLLKHGQQLEDVLQDLYLTTKSHREILRVLTETVESFQGWVIGEISWFDSIIYYFMSFLFIFLITTTKKTRDSRVINLLILFSNFLLERLICFILLKHTKLLYQDIVFYVWYCRYFFMSISLFYFIRNMFNYKDLIVENSKCLEEIKKQNLNILQILNSLKMSFNYNNNFNESVEIINESFPEKTEITNAFQDGAKVKILPKSPVCFKYNLRSKQNTPERVV